MYKSYNAFSDDIGHFPIMKTTWSIRPWSFPSNDIGDDAFEQCRGFRQCMSEKWITIKVFIVNNLGIYNKQIDEYSSRSKMYKINDIHSYLPKCEN